ncbi:MAG TPA: NAD(P)H-binding protein [Burkholderiales bacterium]|nr:NAD(P)H-binding protein [Burkholderiales bacterium]
MSALRTVLLLGATGFIGRRLRAALEAAGVEVICGARPGRAPRDCRSIEVDYTRDHRPSDWLPRLAGVDVVVNAIGILRESGSATFEAVHVDAPTALFRACAEGGVRKIVQISALGADARAASRYHRSKKHGDDRLAALAVPWVIVQPSLVFGEGGRSALLFAELAVLPVVPLPGDGGQHVQPIHVDDLCEAIVRLVQTDDHDRQRIAAVGPRPVTLRAFLEVLRRALGFGTARFLQVPMGAVRLAARVGDRLPRVLLDSESLGMLVRGNVGSPARITAVLGRAPRPIDAFVPRANARALATEARLAWLLPLLRVSVALVWIAAGIVSLNIYPVSESYVMLARVGLTGTAAAIALYGAALIDLALGCAIFVLRDRRWLWRAQMVLIAAYSLVIAIWLPDYWLHPFGPVVKNLPMLAAIALLHELERPVMK